MNYKLHDFILTSVLTVICVGAFNLAAGVPWLYAIAFSLASIAGLGIVRAVRGDFRSPSEA